MRVCVCVCVRTSIYGVNPAEGYLLFNLFVGGPSQQPCFSRPLRLEREWLCVDPRSQPYLRLSEDGLVQWLI